MGIIPTFRKTSALVWLAACLSCSAGAQSFMLGATQQQVTKKNGAPRSYYSGGQYYSAFPLHARSIVWDVYPRFEHGREYQILVLYAADESGSRLHPTMVVKEVRITPDRPAPIKTMLADIPELSMCSPRCSVRVGSDVEGAESIVRLLPPKNGRQVAIDFTMADFNLNSIPVKGLDDTASLVTIWDGTDLIHKDSTRFVDLSPYAPASHLSSGDR